MIPTDSPARAAEPDRIQDGERKQRAKHLGPARRRPMVLDAALSVFAEAGFDNASMAHIARSAGVTKPVLYDCFPGGKQEIFLTLVDREEERILDHLMGVLAITGRMPLGEALPLSIKAFFDYVEVHPQAFAIIFETPGAADPEIARRTERVIERIVDAVGTRARQLAESLDAPLVVGEIFTRSMVAVAYNLARWWARDKPVDRQMLVDLTATWMMKGFEQLIPAGHLSDGLRASG